MGLPPGRFFDFLGNLPPEPRLAIVGSRAASVATCQALLFIVEACRSSGWSLVSGGALGIDGAAHWAALALGVPQMCVLPCGIDRRYPERNADLFARLEASPEASLLFSLSERARGGRGVFASRNRIVVGSAQAVIVAQAGRPSGSYGTGVLALRKERPLAVLPGSSGCSVLAGKGANILPDPGDGIGWEPRLREATADWLLAIVEGRPRPSWRRLWPKDLRWLESEIRTSGPSGIAVDQLSDSLRGICGLVEAEALELVIELSPGRWGLRTG